MFVTDVLIHESTTIYILLHYIINVVSAWDCGRSTGFRKRMSFGYAS